MFCLYPNDERLPAKSPWSDAQRPVPTTQVTAKLAQWPGNTFRFWMPELVGDLWDNWDADVAHQDFSKSERDGLLWSFQRPSKATVEAEITPGDRVLLIECRVMNHSPVDLEDVGVTNCFQLSLAPDFACGDFSRLYVRTKGNWRSLSSLEPNSDYPHYFWTGLRDSLGQVGSHGDMSPLYEEVVEVDHPLMACVAKDGSRCVATASDSFRLLFHNRANENLWCIHSQQMPVVSLGPEETARFRQKVFFVEGGLDDCVSAYGADPVQE